MEPLGPGESRKIPNHYKPVVTELQLAKLWKADPAIRNARYFVVGQPNLSDAGGQDLGQAVNSHSEKLTFRNDGKSENLSLMDSFVSGFWTE